MVFQMCRPVWARFMDTAVLAGALKLPGYPLGAVLGLITATGKFKMAEVGAVDGSAVAVAVLALASNATQAIPPASSFAADQPSSRGPPSCSTPRSLPVR
jgi:hypothetical protein